MITLSLGRRTQGKTTLAYYIAQGKSTRVVFDPRKQFRTSETVSLDGVNLYEELDEREEILVQPVFDVPGVFDLTCSEIMQWVNDNPEEPIAFLVDEARFVDTPSEIPPALDYLLRCTDPKLVDVLFTAHRPVDISVDIRAIADYWAIFHTTQEHDLRVISERCGEEVTEQVRVLAPREAILWDDSLGTWKKYSDPHKWYVDIHKLQTKETSVHA